VGRSQEAGLGGKGYLARKGIVFVKNKGISGGQRQKKSSTIGAGKKGKG